MSPQVLQFRPVLLSATVREIIRSEGLSYPHNCIAPVYVTFGPALTIG